MGEIAKKLLSGRYFATVSIITTYCICILGSILLVIKGKLSIEVFTGIFTAFSTLAGAIITSYFERKDRNGGQ